MLILPRLVVPSGMGRMVISARSTRLAGVHAAVRVGRALRGLARSGRERPSAAVEASFRPAAVRSDLLFVFGRDETDPYVQQSEQALRRMIGGLPADRRRHVEVRHAENGFLAGFETREVQRETIDLVTGWVLAREAKIASAPAPGAGGAPALPKSVAR